MVSMLKRDFFVSIPVLLVSLIFVLIGYAVNISPLFIIMSVVILFVLNLFFFDFHNKVYRSIVSLPISREIVVLSRYIVAGLVTLLFTAFIWAFDLFAHHFIYPNLTGSLANLDFEQLSPLLILFAFLAIVSIISVSIPVYYYAQSISKAITIQILFLLGFVLGLILATLNSTTEKAFLFFTNILDALPILSVVIYILLSITLSYFLSVRLFKRRDIG